MLATTTAAPLSRRCALAPSSFSPASWHILLLDGVTSQHNKELIVCSGWLKKDHAKRRLVMLSSTAWSFGGSAYIALNVKDFFLASWRLDKYLEAIQHDEVFKNVESKLDASNALCVAPED